MIKQVFATEIGNMVEHDRWYFRYHTKEAMRWFGPWMRRYEAYKAYEAFNQQPYLNSHLKG